MNRIAHRPGSVLRALAMILPSLAALFGGSLNAAEPVWVGRFASPDAQIAAPWKVESFDQKIPATQYRARPWDGVDAVEAKADRSMAVLVRPVDVDLAATPVLCWRWRIDAPVASADIHQKSGDDYAARVYLMYRVDEDHLGFSSRLKLALARTVRGDSVPDAAVNYVWDNRSPVGTVVANAYTDRAQMWVLQSGSTQAGRWVAERRDVLADFQRAFGHPARTLYAIALATDTDNTGELATAGFADLRFVAKGATCD